MRATVLFLMPFPTVWMMKRQKSSCTAEVPGKITITLMKTTKKVREDLAAGQPHEALTERPTKFSLQVVFLYNLSTAFN